jgi:hypothetical protein
MLWGSDFPFYSVAYEAQKLAISAAPKRPRSDRGGNARRLFGL